jgi:hypothetical protein
LALAVNEGRLKAAVTTNEAVELTPKFGVVKIEMRKLNVLDSTSWPAVMGQVRGLKTAVYSGSTVTAPSILATFCGH